MTNAFTRIDHSTHTQSMVATRRFQSCNACLASPKSNKGDVIISQLGKTKGSMRADLPNKDQHLKKYLAFDPTA